MRESSDGLAGFRRSHEELFGRRGGSIFETLKFLAGLEANGFAGRNADFFASPGIASDAGLTRFDAEDPELAELDALAATESALEGFEDRFDGLLCFGATDIGFVNDRVYDVELDHTALQKSVARCYGLRGQVVKMSCLIYTLTF